MGLGELLLVVKWDLIRSDTMLSHYSVISEWDQME